MTSQASYTITAVKDGNDLDSILMLWKKTTTNAAPAKPSGTNLNGWTEEMPEFESGAYVWTCNRVAISDPTASTPIYTYTDPVLDTHWKKLDEVYKQGTEIKNTVDNITLKYSNSNGEETSFKLTNGAIDITLLKNQVDDAATTATNFISMRTDGGIEVGNKSGGSWTGYRSQMLADSFNILDENETVLSSFGATDIDLGINSESAMITMCGKTLQFYTHSPYGYSNIDVADSLGINAPSGVYISSHGLDSKLELRVDSVSNVSPGAIQLFAEDFTNSSLADFMVDKSGWIWLYGSAGVGVQSDLEVSGRIRGTTQGVSWYQGRGYATLIATGGTGTSAYYPVIDTKCNTGDWSIGTLGSSLYFVFTTDADYSAGNNNVQSICFLYDGSVRTKGYLLENDSTSTDSFFKATKNSASISFGVGTSLKRGIYDHVISSWTMWNEGSDTYFQSEKAFYFNPADNAPVSVVIGHASGSHPHVSPKTSGYGYVGLTNNRWNNIYTQNVNTTNAVNVSSDRRLKKDISYDLTELDKMIDNLNPVIYRMKDDKEEKFRFGFIAQDAEQAFIDAGLNPDDYAFISKDETEDGVMLSLGYTETNALLWHRQQQLEQRIAELEKRIA